MAFTTQPPAVKYIHMLGGAAAPISHGTEAAGQAWKAGAFLIDDDAGLIVKSTTPIDVSAVAKRTFGLALADASGTTGKDITFLRIGDFTILEGTLSDNTAGAHTLVAADKYATYPIAEGTTTWALDANAVSDVGGAHIIGFKDPVGTVDARVFFIVTSTARGAADAGSGVL